MKKMSIKQIQREVMAQLQPTSFRKPFTVEKCLEFPADGKWCFKFGASPTGLGDSNQRWFDSKEEVVELLTILGITPDKYDVVD